MEKDTAKENFKKKEVSLKIFLLNLTEHIRIRVGLAWAIGWALVSLQVLGRNFPAEIAIAAEAVAFVEGLVKALGRPSAADSRPSVRAQIAAAHAQVRKAWEEGRSPEGVSPAVLLQKLQAQFGPETVFTTDSGNGTFLAMEGLRLERPGRFLAPVDYSCMGYAVPAAIGAGLACPGAPVVALAGDGAFLMTGLEGLTAVHQGIPVLIVLLRDRELAQIAQFQGTAFNRTVASELPDYDAAGFAKGMGILAKTDRLDARVLAKFAQHVNPRMFREMPEQQQELADLVVRRRQLLDLRTMESNRLKQVLSHGAAKAMKKSLNKLLKTLDAEIRGRRDTAS